MSRTTALRRVLLYSHDTYGLGHLRRNLTIAGRLLEGRPGLQIVLMTGSPVAERFALPRGLQLVHLPPVVKTGADRYRPRDERFGFDLVRRARSAIMLDTALRFRPDVLLVDHAPQGMKGELLPVFEGLSSSCTSTRIVLGLRDVLDEPAAVRRTWREQGVYDTLESVYDRVLVYGDATLFDVAAAYALSPAAASSLTYCGYVCKPAAPPAPRPGGEPFVLATAGGGGDGADVLAATRAAARSLGLPSVLVTGPLMGDEDRRRLGALALGEPRATVTAFVPDLPAMMAQATAVVTMGGYNTLCEVVASGAPAVVVPRVQPRLEQAIRAALFARRGAVSIVAPGAGAEGRLRDALGVAAAAGRRSAGGALPLDGLERVDAVLEAEARAARPRHQVEVRA